MYTTSSVMYRKKETGIYCIGKKKFKLVKVMCVNKKIWAKKYRGSKSERTVGKQRLN
jgi:hypothetical protein